MLLLSLKNDWQPLLFESGRCENSFEASPLDPPGTPCVSAQPAWAASCAKDFKRWTALFVSSIGTSVQKTFSCSVTRRWPASRLQCIATFFKAHCSSVQEDYRQCTLIWKEPVRLPCILSLSFDMGSKKSKCGAKVLSNGRSPWKFQGAYFYAQMLILNHFLILLNLSSQIWRWFMIFEINQWYQSQPRNWNMRGNIPPSWLRY